MLKTTFLKRYFDRIQYHGDAKPTLAALTEIMRCQLCSIPFENLDIQAGKVISLKPEVIIDKLIERHRGGYCYEVNGLFSMVLEALNMAYFFVAARPISRATINPKTHMAIVTTLNGEPWLCDLGFGGHGIRAPMKLSCLDAEVNQDGELFMLSLLNEVEYVVKTKVNNEWQEQYAFELTPQTWDSFDAANTYNSTHRDSIFVKKLLIVLCLPVGRKIVFGNTFKRISNDQQEKRFITLENRAELLLDEFGLVEGG